MNIRIVPKTHDREPARPADSAPDGERRQVFLRTVYPANAGIPHAVDFPDGWERRKA